MSKMRHLKEKSEYCYNFYKCGNTDAEILEVCREDYPYYEYFIVDGDKKTLLGSGNEEGEIELLREYT